MTRRRHFPSILHTMDGYQLSDWAQSIRRAKRLHADAILLPSPWSSKETMANILARESLEIETLDQSINQARRQRLGVFLDINLPSPRDAYHPRHVLSRFQAQHIKPLLVLDFAGIIIRSGNDWPDEAILDLERLVRLKEGAVLFIDHQAAPDSELLDGQVDGVVDPGGVAGVSRFLNGRCSGFDFEQYLHRQQHRLGINLAGRVLNPLSLLNVPESLFDLGAGLSFMLRGYPFLSSRAGDNHERVLGPLGQLRRQRQALEWGRFVPMSPIDRPEVCAFGRADERVEEPIIVVARRSPSEAVSLPVALGRFDSRRPFLSLLNQAEPYWVRDGWLDLPSCSSPELLVLGQ